MFQLRNSACRFAADLCAIETYPPHLKHPGRTRVFALVTGGNGFLGKYIVEQLRARGDRVRSLSRRPANDLHPLGVETIQGDLRDQAAVDSACRGVDTVFHVAGVAGIWGPWKHYYTINVQGTINLVTAAQRAHVRRFIYTSSPSVTFDGSDQLAINESAPYPTNWLCHYPHTKALAEQHVLHVNDQRGMLTCALRPHLIWGPRDEHLIPRLFERARRGRLRRIGDGTNQVDIIYVENAATAHLNACDAMTPGSAVAGRAYFISQGEPVLCWPWIDELLSLAALPPVNKSVSRRTAWHLGHLLETTYRLCHLSAEPPMTRFLAAQLSTSHYFDISTACRDFGYRPLVSTAEGMEKLMKSLNGAQ